MAKAADNLQTVTRLPPLPVRPAESHKGMFGKILVIGGSAEMPGAVALAANAAYRAGAGLVRIFCPKSAQPMAIAVAPCATSVRAHETDEGLFALTAREQLLEQAKEHDVLAMGPGMGLSPVCTHLVETVVCEIDKPLVLDAAGLTGLASLGRVPRPAGPLILTPHPGEMKHLLEAFAIDIQLGSDDASRRAAARAVAQRLGCVVLLKGTRTIVTDGKRIYVNTTGNPGMATGGMGDVLTGVTAALLGQDFEPFEAAALGAYLHGLAGDIGVKHLGEYSLMAGDLLDTLPAAFRRYGRKKSASKSKTASGARTGRDGTSSRK